jgi:hypothetical protein
MNCRDPGRSCVRTRQGEGRTVLEEPALPKFDHGKVQRSLRVRIADASNAERECSVSKLAAATG